VTVVGAARTTPLITMQETTADAIADRVRVGQLRRQMITVTTVSDTVEPDL
jgi:hypothetical protein